MNTNTESFQVLPVDQIKPNPEQPRLVFDLDELKSLSQSIQEHGLLQPIRVRGPFIPENDPIFFLVDGERRLRASKLAGMSTINAIVVAPDDHQDGEKLIAAVIANMQRSDLNPIEEANAYDKLREKKISIRNISLMVGKSTSSVNFKLKLIEFESEIQDLFASGKLPMDPNVVYGLDKLPGDIRVSLAKKFAQNSLSTSGIRKSISRVLKHLGEEKDLDLSRTKRSPAMTIANPENNTSKIFEVLSKDGITPAWKYIDLAATETCKNCDLVDMASTKMCKDCPAVELVRRLMKLVNEPDKVRA